MPAQPPDLADPAGPGPQRRGLDLAVGLQPLLSISSIGSRDNGTGGVARLVSQMSPGVRAAGQALWRDIVLLRASAELRAVAYGAPSSSQATLIPSSSWPGALRLGAGVIVQQRLQLLAVAGVARHPFVTALASRRFALVTTALPEVGLALGTYLVRERAWRLDVELLTLFVGGRGPARSGGSIAMRLDATRELSARLALSGGGGFTVRQQGTPLTSQLESLWQLGLGLRWSP